MSQLEVDSVRIAPEPLRVFVSAVLRAEAVPEHDADYVAWHLVEANLRGIDSHGVARLSHYVSRLQAGSIHARPAMRLDRRSRVLGLVDGGHGLGHIVMRYATDAVAEIARDNGAGWVAVSNSSHCGALAPFGLALADRGMVGFVFTHVDPMVLPHGASQPFCGTNPICIAAPGADGKSMCLDMATSIVPWNVISNAQLENVPIRAGWAVDHNGIDTTDAHKVAALYPVGEHKGSGLGIMIDVLCALLSGAPYGPHIPKMYGDRSQHRCLGGLVGAINIADLANAGSFMERLASMCSEIGGLRPRQAGEQVLYPGEPELLSKTDRSEHGIPIGVRIYQQLNELGRARGIPALRQIQAEAH